MGNTADIVYFISSWFTIWFVIEFILFVVLFGIFLFWCKPIIKADLWKKIVWFSQDSKRVVFFLSVFLLVSNLIYLFIAQPLPIYADEFSFIFQAETFLEGRLTNPTPEYWEHFETFFIVQKPYFVSKFPPGQALFLALGKLLFNNYIIGIWISFYLACLAVYFMLKQWTTNVWAFLGTLAVASNGQFLNIWSNGYWGGAIAMMGGALLFGTIKAMVERKTTVRDGIFVAIGVSLLAYSRPYEGLFCCFLLLIPIVKYRLWQKISLNNFIFKLAGPAVIVLFFTLGFLLHYNKVITGGYLSLPYNLYHSQYETARSFVFQKPHPEREYLHADMESFHKNEAKIFFQRKTVAGFFKGVFVKIFTYTRFYIRMAFLLPFVFLLFTRKNFWEKYALAIFVVLLFSNFLSTWEQHHYLAPVTGIGIFLVIAGLKKLLNSKFTYKQQYINTVVAMLLLSPILGFVSHYRNEKSKFTKYKVDITNTLNQNSKKDLVFIRYNDSSGKSTHSWNYNNPNLEQNDVIWARDMGSEKNHQLMEYYNDRNIYFLIGDKFPYVLKEYNPAITQN
jgi:hypothetical protein